MPGPKSVWTKLEPGDYLLDWRRGTRALRYVHHYDPAELVADCRVAGLVIERQWTGDEGLGLYVTGSGGSAGKNLENPAVQVD